MLSLAFRAFSVSRGGMSSMRPVHVFVSAKLRPDGSVVCPDYEDSDYREDLDRAFRSVGLSWSWVPVTLSDIEERVEAARAACARVLNLCDGDDAQGLPGVQVIEALDRAGVPYSGSDRFFYRLTTSRRAMKHRLRAAGVSQPDWKYLEGPDEDPGSMIFPVILKPDVSGGSYGIEKTSVVRDATEAERQLERLFSGALHGRDFRRDGVVAEEFIDGPEFSVLVVGDWNDPEGLEVFPAVERFFADAWPAILTYEINWERYEEPSPSSSRGPGFWHGKVESADPRELEDLARKAFVAVGGIGYGRVDLRRSRSTGRLAVLEVNANCGLSSDPHSSTVGAILSLHGLDFGTLLGRILARAEARAASRCRRIHAFVPALDEDDKICWGYGEPSFADDFAKSLEEGGLGLEWHRIWKDAGIEASVAKIARGDVVFNVCDGDDRTYPGISVVRGLARDRYSFTGADAPFYAISTSKTLMKAVLVEGGVDTAPWAKFEGDDQRFFEEIAATVDFPCLFKPDESAGSFGIRRNSRVTDSVDLAERFRDLRDGHDESQELTSGWFAEAFVSGREFTVLVSGDSAVPSTILAYTPLEYRFSESLPDDERFLFFARRYETDAPEDAPVRYQYARPEPELDPVLRDVARRAYAAVQGRGYARVDMRRDEVTGIVHVLEVNANCGLGSDPTISTMGAILASDLETYAAFLNRAIGLARFPARP